MKPIKCWAIDDERPALQLVVDYIKRTPFLEFAGSFHSATKALAALGEQEVDLLLLDINMPDLSGLELSRLLPEHVKVIFTTAYDQYAVESYRVNAVDYLLKPFSYPEFLEAVVKAQKLLVPIEENISPTSKGEDCLFVKSDYKLRKIFFDDILYVEGLKDYARFHLLSGKPVMSLMSLKSLEQTLPTDKFMRVHRSFIVNLSRIEVIDRSRIVFGDVYIPVGDQYKPSFQQYINNNSA